MKNSSVSFAASFIEGVQRSREEVFLLVSLFLNPPLTTSYSLNKLFSMDSLPQVHINNIP